MMLDIPKVYRESKDTTPATAETPKTAEASAAVETIITA
jgi:hypothetical protein